MKSLTDNEGLFISIEEALERLATEKNDSGANIIGMLLKLGATEQLPTYFLSDNDGIIYPAKPYLGNYNVMQDALEFLKNPTKEDYKYGKYKWLREDLYKFLKSKGFETKWVKWLMPASVSVEQAASDVVKNTTSKANDKPPCITDGMVTITKLAITAAWEIEGEVKRKATATEVIKRLQEWVTSKRYAELIEIIPHGVKWMTTAPDDKPYDIDACRATLKSWHKSLSRA